MYEYRKWDLEESPKAKERHYCQRGTKNGDERLVGCMLNVCFGVFCFFLFFFVDSSLICVCLLGYNTIKA